MKMKKKMVSRRGLIILGISIMLALLVIVSLPAKTSSKQEQQIQELNENDASSTNTKEVDSITLIIFGVQLFILIILCLIFYNKEKKLTEKVECAEKRIKSLSKQLSKANSKYSNLRSWKRNAIDAHPTIQNEIDNMIARKRAQEFNRKYASVIDLKPIMENFVSFNDMFTTYENLSRLAQGFVTFDIDIVKEKRQVSGEIFAKDVSKKIENVCDRCSGTRHDRQELNETVLYYNTLPAFIKAMIEGRLIHELNSKRAKAEAAQKKYQSSHEHIFGVGGSIG